MFRCDYHLHTDHSADCSTPMEAQIRQAIQIGMDELCFTDHLELGFRKWNYEEIDIDAYYQDYQMSCKKYPEITLKFGIEAGITCSEEHFQRLDGFLNSHPFDFIIVSAHAMQEEDALDPKFFQGRNFSEACRVYIEALYQRLVRMNPALYNCVGHIDFPVKGLLRMGASQAELKYEYAPEAMDALFRYLIKKEKCLEINTSPMALMQPEDIRHNNWLKRYAELGGEVVTIGSDSHRPELIGAHYDVALEIAADSGIRYVATFQNKKPIYHRIR